MTMTLKEADISWLGTAVLNHALAQPYPGVYEMTITLGEDEAAVTVRDINHTNVYARAIAVRNAINAYQGQGSILNDIVSLGGDK